MAILRCSNTRHAQTLVAHAYGQLARFNDCYGKQHWDALMELLGYMRANRDRDKMYIARGAGSQLSCYCDADWNASYDSKSTSGWIVFDPRCHADFMVLTLAESDLIVDRASRVYFVELCGTGMCLSSDAHGVHSMSDSSRAHCG